MEILRQLGDLFLQAVPTVIIVFLFYLFMRWAFFTPIQKAIAEREAKIEGARKDAATVQAAANQDLQDYNDALKKARAEIYAEQEVARQAILQERSKNLKATRPRRQLCSNSVDCGSGVRARSRDGIAGGPHLSVAQFCNRVRAAGLRDREIRSAQFPKPRIAD